VLGDRFLSYAGTSDLYSPTQWEAEWLRDM